MITTAINWISVTDQLPDDDMTVLIADTQNDVPSASTMATQAGAIAQPQE